MIKCRGLAQILDFYQFNECRNRKGVFYSRINSENYLVLKLFGKFTIDLFHCTFYSDQDPCQSDPISEEVIKLSFDPVEDSNLLREYYNELKRELKLR